jgi:hypothetical protein
MHSISPTNSDCERSKATEYLEHHRIPEVMNRLTIELLIHAPEHPVSFCIQFFHTQSLVLPSEEELRQHLNRLKTSEEKVKSEESKKYLLIHKIPWLLEDMLSALLFEKPDDPLSFVLSWLRWNRGKYASFAIPDESVKEQ